MFIHLDGSCSKGAKQLPWLKVLALVVLVAQSACITTTTGFPRGSTPGHYGYSNAPVGIDSPSATCRNSLSACIALYGKEVASASAVLKVVLEEPARKSIEEELTKCADLARSEVLLRYPKQFKGPAHDADECKQETKFRGRHVTWAIRLGIEMHEVAQKCAEKRLSKVRPGGFSLEQRYRFDRQTRQKKLVSSEDEKALEKFGNGGELRGTLKPDIVVHAGNPLEVLEGADQGTLYQEAFGDDVARIVPRLGIIR